MYKIIELLTKINGGSLIENQSNQNTIKDLFYEDFALCVDERDGKHYFFAKYNVQEGKDNLWEIEQRTFNNKKVFEDERPNPSLSYLILFWQVEEINDDVFSKVIQIEENEFFYKKYVFYYTSDEISMLRKWIDEQKHVSISGILNEISKEGDEISEKFLLLIRLFVKIPFWRFEFKKDELEDFEDLVNRKVSAMRGVKDMVKELLEFIAEKEMNTDIDAENLANEIYERYMME